MHRSLSRSTSRVVFTPGQERVRAFEWGKGLVVQGGDVIATSEEDEVNERVVLEAIRRAYGEDREPRRAVEP